MIKIHFLSGKEIELDQPWDKFPQKLTFGGLRLLKAGMNKLVPLNSSTIEFVEYVPDAPVQEAPEVEAPVKEPEPEKQEPKPESEKPETAQEKNDRLIGEMMAKSNCHKNKHEGQELDWYYQDVSVGKSKAKARRYFPVCTFCGVRERYVKVDSLTDEQKENAKQWDK